MKSAFIVGFLGVLAGAVVALLVQKIVTVTQAKNRKFIIGAIALVAGVATVFTVKIIMSEGDTPIVIAGGSLYGVAIPQGWSPNTPGKSYSARVGFNTDYISLKDFTLVSGGPAPGSITGTGGWNISISNKDSGGNTKSDAVFLCSKQNCNPQSGLDGNVYLSAGAKGRWKEQVSLSLLYELRFHDTDCDGSSGDTESTCDTIAQITITTKNQPPVTYLCPSGTCRIIVGM